ncbi:MAG TPA: hypothetical protein DCW29_09700, partial [Janthinobacterium sp.]|nr:hypothetical protein [Janthinobacterium sp.]
MNSPMFIPQNPAYPGAASGIAGNGMAAHGIDVANMIDTIVQTAARVLPALLLGTLAAQQPIQQANRQAGVIGAGANPHSLFGAAPPAGVGLNLFNAPQFGAPQLAAAPGIDIGAIVQSVAQATAQALPALIIGLLSAHPQIQQ